MTSKVVSTPARTRPRSKDPLPRRPVATMSKRRPSASVPARHGRGGRVLFEIAFQSAMSDSDVARLARTLDLWTHMHPKMRPDPTSPGVARLDHFSGLFLERGAEDGKWVLEARTWGSPAPESVHEWHMLAAQAARQLNPGVHLPERAQQPPAETPDRLLGHVQNKRVGALGHRLVGLP